MRRRTQRKSLDRIAHQRSKRKVETKLLLPRGKILPLKNPRQRKRINHQLYIRVLHQGDIDHHQEVKLIEEGLLEDIQGHDESALHQGEEGFRDLQEDTTDIPYPEAEVDRGTIVMDHDVDFHHFLDAGDPILEEDPGLPEDREIDEKDLEIAVEVVVGQEVDLEDLLWVILPYGKIRNGTNTY